MRGRSSRSSTTELDSVPCTSTTRRIAASAIAWSGGATPAQRERPGDTIDHGGTGAGARHAAGAQPGRGDARQHQYRADDQRMTVEPWGRTSSTSPNSTIAPPIESTSRPRRQGRGRAAAPRHAADQRPAGPDWRSAPRSHRLRPSRVPAPRRPDRPRRECPSRQASAAAASRAAAGGSAPEAMTSGAPSRAQDHAVALRVGQDADGAQRGDRQRDIERRRGFRHPQRAGSGVDRNEAARAPALALAVIEPARTGRAGQQRDRHHLLPPGSLRHHRDRTDDQAGAEDDGLAPHAGKVIGQPGQAGGAGRGAIGQAGERDPAAGAAPQSWGATALHACWTSLTRRPDRGRARRLPSDRRPAAASGAGASAGTAGTQLTRSASSHTRRSA